MSYIARFEGFLQVYQLQTECDEEETWRDLVSVIHIAETWAMLTMTMTYLV